MYNDKLVLACEKVLPNCLFIFASEYKSVEPKSTYCLITLVGETPISTERSTYFTEHEDDPTEELISRQCQLLYNFTFHGKSNSDSENLARRFTSGFESSFYVYSFLDQGFSILGTKTVTRVNQAIDVVNYIRDVVVVDFLVNRIDSFEVDYIEKVETDGTIDNYEFEVDIDYGD